MSTSTFTLTNSGWVKLAEAPGSFLITRRSHYPFELIISSTTPDAQAGGFGVKDEQTVTLDSGDALYGRAVKDDNADVSVTRAALSGSVNVGNKFREAFEAYDPVNGDRWTQQLAPGDIIALDGNTAAASYLVISKDPMSVGESRIWTIPTWDMPFEAAIGLSLSQRTLGQEFAIEFVSVEDSLPAPSDLPIATIQQATTTLTVTTTSAHGLRVGQRIGIRDCADSRMNYPALVVASTPSPIQFTATAGPGGNLPSVTAGPFTSGFVFYRSAMGLAPNGTSMLFENATATNASFYVRSESGDVLPMGGTLAGSHSLAVATTSSVQAANTPGAYAFQPTNEYRLTQFAHGVQWSDVPVDSIAAATNRAKRTQVVPDIEPQYRIRIRAANNPSLTRPVAHIQQVSKAGSTVATVVTQTPHGLTTGDLIAAYGVRDFANFANLAAATAVASVIDANTFTVAVWGSSGTATSQGGVIYRVNGGNLPSALGAIAQVVQSVTRTANILTLGGSTAWAGLLIGDYVNLAGLHDTGGVDLNLDGAYRVRNIATTTLELEPIGDTPTGTDIVTTNCGGAVIKRTDLRISFVRAMDFDRQRVEILPRPQGDISEAASVNVQNNPFVTLLAGSNSIGNIGTVSTLTGGGAAEDAVAGLNPVIGGGVVRTATTPVTLVAGDAVRDTHASSGAKVIKPYAVPEAGWNASLALTTTTAATIQAAAGASLKRHITALQAINTGASAVDLIILDGATERWRLPLPVNVPVAIEFPTELATTANTALNAGLSAAGTVRANFQGYTSA